MQATLQKGGYLEMIAADDSCNKLLFVVNGRGMRAGFQRVYLTRARLHNKDRNLH